jgi:hypothetical protein
MFARMLANYDRIVAMGTEDDYEEMLRVLDDMSVREFQLLLLLRDFEERAKKDQLADADTTDAEGAMLQQASNFWEDFRAAVVRTGVPMDEVRGMLARLRRTGMYETFAGRAGNDGEKSHTTALLDCLLVAVARHEDRHPPNSGAHGVRGDQAPDTRWQTTGAPAEHSSDDVESLIASLDRHSDEIMQGRVFSEDSADVIREMREERDADMASV